MPRNPVVNRQNIDSPLRQRSLDISDRAREQLRDLAAALHVSQGSVLDCAVRELAALPPHLVADLLYKHGHLDPKTYPYVANRARNLTDKTPSTTRRSPPERRKRRTPCVDCSDWSATPPPRTLNGPRQH
ncbi:hypothetical protein OHA25_60975 (plasmid) [Nonomuraea sp. NBC_00507]|uniref:hypothetical protein n=1 Tax=Nonomuraea sp. NBC_00507 TaxID=2976002 RepID=UPI002E19F915